MYLALGILGYAHGLAGGIFKLRDYRGPWVVLLPWADSKRPFPSVLFAFFPVTSPPQSLGSLMERETGPSSFNRSSWAESHSLPSFSVSSPRMALLAHHWAACCLIGCWLCHHLLHSIIFSEVPSLTSGCANALITQVSWYAIQRHFIFFISYGYLISCKLRGKEKGNDSYHHCALYLTSLFSLKYMAVFHCHRSVDTSVGLLMTVLFCTIDLYPYFTNIRLS